MPRSPDSHQTSDGRSIQVLACGLLNLFLLPLLAARPAVSAEQIRVSYGILSRTISVDSLETYANTGQIDEELAIYARNASPKQLAQLREILLARIPLNSVEVSQFLYTPLGERLLDRLAEPVRTDSTQANFYGIRAALILAADDPQGLTLLNVFRQFPLAELEIDIARSQAIAQSVEQLINQTNETVEQINRQAALEAGAAPFSGIAPVVNPGRTPPLVNSRLVNPQQPGSSPWEKRTLSLTDQTRNQVFAGITVQRTFPVDLYVPLERIPHPVIVISHGLGSDRTSFAYLAEHLASYGFVVAVPEHPGSSAEQLQALLEGTANEVTSPNEFIDRPIDITYLLDELTRLSQSDPALQGRLNMEQVGVIGQSFGGYTALALAGAPIHLDQLETDCLNLNDSLNLSLFLQCVALDLPQPRYDLSDPRVKGAIAINPLTSSIMGPESLKQINIPVMMITGSDDTITPALTEQIQPFTWLTAPDKYLMLMNNGTHFSTIESSPNAAVPVPSAVVGPAPALARTYIEVLSVAFFQTYIAEQPDYAAYLNAAYVDLLDREPLDLSLVRSLPLENFQEED